MLDDFVDGLSLKDVSKKYNVNYRTVLRYSKKGNWVSKKAAYNEEVDALEEVPDRIRWQRETIDNTIRSLAEISTMTRDSVLLGRTSEIPMNIKTLTDSLDKLIRLQMFIDAGGVAKSEVSVKKQSIDWNQIIEQSLKAKKQQGSNFDEEAFLRQAIDLKPEKKS